MPVISHVLLFHRTNYYYLNEINVWEKKMFVHLLNTIYWFGLYVGIRIQSSFSLVQWNIHHKLTMYFTNSTDFLYSRCYVKALSCEVLQHLLSDSDTAVFPICSSVKYSFCINITFKAEIMQFTSLKVNFDMLSFLVYELVTLLH